MKGENKMFVLLILLSLAVSFLLTSGLIWLNDDLFIYETVVTKERATVTAKWVKEHLI